VRLSRSNLVDDLQHLGRRVGHITRVRTS